MTLSRCIQSKQSYLETILDVCFDPLVKALHHLHLLPHLFTFKTQLPPHLTFPLPQPIPKKSLHFHLLRMLSLIKIVEDLHQNQVSLTPRLEAQEVVNDAFHSFMARKTATNDRVQDMLAQILS